MTEKENIENMKRCPRWDYCSIPKCPLDKDMALRFEAPEDGICPLRRLTEKKIRRGKIKKEILSGAMKKLVEFVPIQNLVKD